ncbi:hypothetical protein CVT91_09430 [Candidatus Atribacteria bacterium HGW-Atribacteria-1]|nr:MAG: hypothetical protein CVT91_09430 [Candidatus Atribacteria bacterium HGW-Atribacteria-1]
MRLAYMVATPEVAGNGVLGLKGDLGKNLIRLREHGYEGVEFIVKDPKVLDWEKVKRLVDSVGLEVCAITTGNIYMECNLSLLSSDQSIEQLAWQRLQEVIDFASVFRTKVNIGALRGKIPYGWEKEDSNRKLLDYYQMAAAYAKPKDVEILLEPIAYILTDTVNSTNEAIYFIKKVNRDNFGLELDLFHMNLEERSLGKSFRSAKPYLRHIHISDSNRKPPGYGNLPFSNLIAELKAIQYHSFLSIECFQFPDEDTALRESISVLRRFLC